MKRLAPFLIAVCLVASSIAFAAEPGDGDLEFFETKIRPVLVEHCYECHSADAKIIRGGLRVDSREALRRGGESGAAVVPGDFDNSLLLAALRHESFEMPPDQKLPDAVIRDFEAWIERGAADPRESESLDARHSIDLKAGRQFWAFQPPRFDQLPLVEDKLWPRSRIDRFILASLESQGLSPADDADRETLIRRAYFDLMGLPPAVGQIDAFVHDPSPQAFQRVIDRLLESPEFGERWGRHWLDVARFAESSGGGRTQLFPRAWQYRDYVIRSFNSDKPYDQFIAEQIAGDLMESRSWQDRAEKLTALGFLALGPTNYELQDKELLRMEVIDEQIDTIGRSMLGLTVGCARCHDHKFDPIPTRDYYALAGIFRSTKSLMPGNVAKWVERDLPMDEQAQRRYDAYRNERSRIEERLATLKQESKKLGGKATSDRSMPRSKELPGVVVDDVRAVFIGDWTPSTSVPQYVDEGYRHCAAEGASATFATRLSDGEYEVRLAYSGHANRASNASVTIQHAGGIFAGHVNQRERGPIDGLFVSLGRFRFESGQDAVVTLTPRDADGTVIADAVQFLPEKIEPVPADALAKDASQQELSQARKQLNQQIKQLQAELDALNRSAPAAPEQAMGVVEESETGDYFVCIRGNAHNLGDQVPRGFLQVMQREPLPAIPGDQSGRLELANWLSSPDHPLTARVMVNRIWQHLIGSGLVRTPDSFGVTGESPTHPELLDFLALEFIEDGWSIKRMIRQIMLSRVYQQSSTWTAQAQQVDPENKLCSHANRKRLSAEALRDAILLMSGRLDRQPFGNGIKAGTTQELNYQFTSTRRSVYVPAFRNTLLDLFDVFDGANPNLVSGKRNVSAVPTQALLMMNSPFVIENAERFAERLLSYGPGTDAQRVETAYRMALGRLPTAGETQRVIRYIENSSKRERGEAEIWTSVCHSLFACLDFRYTD